MQPAAGTDQFVMTRPNPVRRDKSRPPVSSPRRSGAWMASARLPLRLLRRQLVHELRPSRVRVSAVEYKDHLIEAFEDQPGRWFAYFRRLDGQSIAGAESNSLRTPSARYSKEDAVEFAKEAIDGLPDF
jgi:hypothetical protein